MTFMKVFFSLLLLLSGKAFSQPDYILYHGKVFTSDKKNIWVEAIAIKGERISAVGNNNEILKLKGVNTRVIDLEGRVVIPGINDAHNHAGAEYPARRFELAHNPLDPTPWNLLRDSIIRIVKEIPEGTFIITTINPDLLGEPLARRKQLDSIAPHHPVMFSAWTGHGKIMNSAALSFFGFNDQSQTLGGRFDKDRDQHLTGLIEEYASFPAGAFLSSRLDRSQIIGDLRKFYAEASALGITTVQNMCTQHFAKQVTDIYTTEEFSCRVRLVAFPFTSSNELLLHDWDNLFHSLNQMNYISGVKLILDATPVERLAALRQAYSDRPAEYGRLNFDPQQLKLYMQYCLQHNQQIIIHAVGDSAIVSIIRTMRSLHPDSFWKSKRLRLEHAELAVVKEEDINTLKQLGIVIVQNPTHLALPSVIHARFGASRTKYLQAMQTLSDNNIPFAIGSDGPMNPYLNIMLATMHPDNPKEAITREEAVIAYTHGSAYAEFRENEKGILAKDKLADLVVLSQDIFDISPDKLPATESVMTFLGGKIVYDKNLLK